MISILEKDIQLNSWNDSIKWNYQKRIISKLRIEGKFYF